MKKENRSMLRFIYLFPTFERELEKNHSEQFTRLFFNRYSQTVIVSRITNRIEGIRLIPALFSDPTNRELLRGSFLITAPLSLPGYNSVLHWLSTWNLDLMCFVTHLWKAGSFNDTYWQWKFLPQVHTPLNVKNRSNVYLTVAPNWLSLAKCRGN